MLIPQFATDHWACLWILVLALQEVHSKEKTLSEFCFCLAVPANAEAAIDKLRSLIDPGLGPSGGSLMLPQTMQHESIGSTTPLHWRYSRDSVWSGVSEDWKILGTAKSIVAKGFLHLNFNNFVSWRMDFSYLVSDTLSVTMKKPVLA